jgi:hypothetical protein
MLVPGLIDRNLPDRRADADDPHAVGSELGLDLVAQRVVEVEHVFSGDAAQLEMRDVVLAADADLLVEVG